MNLSEAYKELELTSSASEDEVKKEEANEVDKS